MSYKDAKGWLTEKEREFLFSSSQNSQGTLLNTGVEYGASLVCMQEANSVMPIVAIDINLAPLVAPLGPHTIPVQRDSGEIARNWPEWAISLALPTTSLGFIFIDGDHGYPAVTLDCLFADHLIVGGVICFHDCYSWDAPLSVHPHSPGVNLAVTDWLAAQPVGKWRELPVVDSIRAFERLV